MDATTLYNALLGPVGLVLLLVVAYFLKRTMSLLDKCVKDIHALETNKVSEKDFSAFRTETREKLGELSGEIKDIRADYITKDDFVREISNVNRQLEIIRDILLERKGRNNG